MTSFEVRPDVHSFLQQFSAAGGRHDPDAQIQYWAETFLSLDPNRTAWVTRSAMLDALPQRRRMFERIGATASELVAAEETDLDDFHTLVRTSWRWHFASAHDAEEELVLRSTFLLRREATGWTIVVYLNHQDVAAIIAERASTVAVRES